MNATTTVERTQERRTQLQQVIAKADEVEARYQTLWREKHGTDPIAVMRARAELPAIETERFAAQADAEEARRDLQAIEAEDRVARTVLYESEARPLVAAFDRALTAATNASEKLRTLQVRAHAAGVDLPPLAWHEFDASEPSRECRLSMWRRWLRENKFMS